MKNNSHPLLLGVYSYLILASLASCINATTDIVQQYPSKPAESVVVLEHGERLPDESTPIGNVNTKKGGDECQRYALLKKAIRLTAAAGGNVLRLTNKGDSCHELNGIMALMPEGASLPQYVTVPHPALLWKDEPDSTTRKRMFGNLPRQVVKVSAGPAWLTSSLDSRGTKYKATKPGFMFAADLEFFGASEMGCAINFRGSSTSLGRDHLTLFNFGVSLAQQFLLGQQWRLVWALGPGVGYHSSDDDSGWRFNALGRISAEYMVTPNFAIGADLNGTIISLESTKPWWINQSDQYFGKSYMMGQVGLSVGVRLYY